ncbi:MAG: tripartite tricarboxylate transporter substrate binding protein, partial [Synergistaceae bacterium]|nr:tripartite tricarboxylate transporter substrate binding protein [Synergistaceae bacterium]
AEAIPALLGGHVEFSMVNPGEAISQIMAGQLKPLGVCSDVRMAGLPDVPTMTELGYPIVTGTWRGIAVPKGTPEDVKAILGAALEKAVAEKEFVDFMNGRTLGIRFLNAADFKTFVENDVKALDAVVEEVKKQQQQ